MSAVWRNGGGKLLLPQPVVGEYGWSAFMTGAGTGSGLTLAVNTLYATPFMMNRRTNIDMVQVSVDVLEAGVSVIAGIYTDKKGYPGDLLATSIAVSIATTGTKNLTFTAVEVPEKFWVAVNTNATGTGKISSLAASRVLQMFNDDAATFGGTNTTNTGLSVAYTYNGSTLPSAFPAGAAYIASAPMFRVRYA